MIYIPEEERYNPTSQPKPTSSLSLFKDTQHSLFLLTKTKQTTTVTMDAIVQAILNLSKLEVSLIKIEDATPE
jgi:hypothetical protein